MAIGADDRVAARDAVQAVLEQVAGAERLLSSWTAASELGQFNHAAPAAPVRLSSSLFAALREASRWSDRTGRAFDPGIGALIDAWDMRGSGRHPTVVELEEARRAAGIAPVPLDSVTRSATRPSEAAWIDAGAFGKGLALRMVRRTLAARRVRSASVNLGGQLLLVGSDSNGMPWEVGIAHPRHRDRRIRSLLVKDASVATTGQSERHVSIDGTDTGHVLDPRTGRPVPAWGSVTVVAQDPFEADVLATALFVMGPEEAVEWGDEHQVAAVIVAGQHDGTLVVTVTDAARSLMGPHREPR
jgi:thiamine biosynthesis lipoprotein